MPHSTDHTFKPVLTITLGCDTFTFEKAEVYKAYLANPSVFAGSDGGGGGGGDTDGATAEEEKEKDEEESVDMGGGKF